MGKTEERISELKNITLDITQSEHKEKIDWKKMNSSLGTWGTLKKI